MRASTISVSKYKATDSTRTHTTQRSLITYQQSSELNNKIYSMYQSEENQISKFFHYTSFFFLNEIIMVIVFDIS